MRYNRFLEMPDSGRVGRQLRARLIEKYKGDLRLGDTAIHQGVEGVDQTIFQLLFGIGRATKIVRVRLRIQHLQPVAEDAPDLRQRQGDAPVLDDEIAHRLGLPVIACFQQALQFRKIGIAERRRRPGRLSRRLLKMHDPVIAPRAPCANQT
nr:hypothetical protein [Thiocapsa sp.]